MPTSGTNVTLQPADFLIGPTEGDPNLCLSWPIAQIPPENDGIDWHFGKYIPSYININSTKRRDPLTQAHRSYELFIPS